MLKVKFANEKEMEITHIDERLENGNIVLSIEKDNTNENFDIEALAVEVLFPEALNHIEVLLNGNRVKLYDGYTVVAHAMARIGETNNYSRIVLSKV